MLAAVVDATKPGAKVLELCQLGDQLIEEGTGKVYNQKKEGKKMEKGIAFPTCVSPNHCVGHYSPLSSEPPQELKEGDIVKIDLGVHVDGYIAVVAHTVVCGQGEAALTGRQADAMVAAWTVAECMQRMFNAGVKNTEITDMISKVAEAYDVRPVEGVLSHQMKRHVIDANKVIIAKATTEQQVAEKSFDASDVFAFDIVMSTGEGKARPAEQRTTVYKRDVEEKYSLKMKASRAFFSEVNARFPTLPFTLRAGDEKQWRLGVTECVKHGLFTEYPVLYEKADAIIAHVKFTALLLPSGNVVRLTSGPPPNATSEKKLEDEGINAILAQSTDAKKKKKANKKKKKAGGGEGGDGDGETKEGGE